MRLKFSAILLGLLAVIGASLIFGSVGQGQRAAAATMPESTRVAEYRPAPAEPVTTTTAPSGVVDRHATNLTRQPAPREVRPGTTAPTGHEAV